MRFLHKFPVVRTRLVKFFLSISQSKVWLHSCSKPPKTNQAFQSYLKSNNNVGAMLLFRKLLRDHPASIDSFSFLFVLKACTHTPSLLEGIQLHTVVVKFGFELIIQLQTSLLNLYSATGNLVDAHRVFDEIPSKNVVCWTALISAYVDNQKPNKALLLFRQMQVQHVEPDQITVTVALSACADLGALEMGEWIHAYIRVKGLNVDLSLKNAIINMYTKCGDIGTARQLFDGSRRRDVTTWTSMIVAHALHGQAKEALKLFKEMKEINKRMRKNQRKVHPKSSLIIPNDVTFIGVLMACSHAGMVKEGKQHFRSMTEDYGLKPRDSHFGSMVDLFCRAGLLKEAYDFILEMPIRPNAVIWRTLLAACSLHGNTELGGEVQRKLLELEPGHVGDYVALSNMFAAKGMWDDKVTVRNQIKQRRAPGCSSIEVESAISEFVSGKNDHPLMAEILGALKQLTNSMRACGYSPEFSCLTEY